MTQRSTPHCKFRSRLTILSTETQYFAKYGLLEDEAGTASRPTVAATLVRGTLADEARTASRLAEARGVHVSPLCRVLSVTANASGSQISNIVTRSTAPSCFHSFIVSSFSTVLLRIHFRVFPHGKSRTSVKLQALETYAAIVVSASIWTDAMDPVVPVDCCNRNATSIAATLCFSFVPLSKLIPFSPSRSSSLIHLSATFSPRTAAQLCLHSLPRSFGQAAHFL